MTFNRELLKGSTDLLILTMLSQRPAYGYHIAKEINTRSDGLLRLKEGSLYPMLHKLEEHGLIRGRWAPSERGPERKYYHITARGRRVLAVRVHEWHQFTMAVSAALEGASDG
jgi:PadR family transcriptional regulator PadR